jgi:hypothetical protein
MLPRVVLAIGALLVLIALFADPLGLGRPGFGWRQGLGLVIGGLVVLAELYMRRRRKAST